MSISVQHISKNYKDQKALDGIEFEVQKGAIVGLLGPNGAGKSTLMKILTTYLEPSDGTAHVNGHSVAEDKPSVQRSVGYLPEHNPLYTELYVKEYLEFNASIYGCDKQRIEAVIQQTGLTPESHKKIGQLSKGYRQRVGLATALLHDPEVLILDEPTTGLDPNQLVEIRRLIREVGREKTVLLSTHIMQEVEALCDRVIIIDKGKKVLDASMEELNKDQGQIIVVAFDYRIEEPAFNTLSDLENVVNTGGFQYELRFSTKEDRRPAVFDFAQQNGLKILELHQKSNTLEKRFIELTTPGR